MFSNLKICPFCLGEVTFANNTCPQCNETIPPKYIKEYDDFPPVIVNTVGKSGHGKTVFFSSLFYTLKNSLLSNCWDKFYYFPVSQEGLETISKNADSLALGTLPSATPKIFPKPVLAQLANVPQHRNSTMLIFDVGGESFNDSRNYINYVPFLKRASTVLVLISVPDLTRPNVQMKELLESSVLGMHNSLGAKTKEKHLVVVFTKADQIQFPREWVDIRKYLEAGSINELRNVKEYKKSLQYASERLRAFTNSYLGAKEFINAAEANYKSVEFSLVSALGAAPINNENTGVEVVPKRIMDPLLWMIQKSPLWH